MIQRRGSFTAVVVEFAGIVIFMLTNTNTVSKCSVFDMIVEKIQCSDLLKEKYSPHHWKVIYLKINFVPITTAGKLIYKFSLYPVLRFQRVLVTQPFGSCFRCTSTSSSKMGAALLKTTSSSKLATHMWCPRTGSQTEAALVLLVLVTCLLDIVLILWGEIRSWSLMGVKELTL